MILRNTDIYFLFDYVLWQCLYNLSIEKQIKNIPAWDIIMSCKTHIFLGGSSEYNCLDKCSGVPSP